MNIAKWIPRLVLVICLMIGTGYYFARHGWPDGERVEELTALAPQMGMKALGRNLAVKDPNLLAAPLFREGKEGSRILSVAMGGDEAGMSALVGDYQYDYDDNEGSSHTNSQTVAAYANAGHKLPVFELQEKNTGNFFSITGNTKERAVAFDEQPEFAKRFYLLSDDREGTRRVFTPAVRTLLMGVDAKRDWQVQASGPWLIFFGDDRYVKVDDYRGFVAETGRVASAFFQKCGCATTN